MNNVDFNNIKMISLENNGNDFDEGNLLHRVNLVDYSNFDAVIDIFNTINALDRQQSNDSMSKNIADLKIKLINNFVSKHKYEMSIFHGKFVDLKNELATLQEQMNSSTRASVRGRFQEKFDVLFNRAIEPYEKIKKEMVRFSKPLCSIFELMREDREDRDVELKYKKESEQMMLRTVDKMRKIEIELDFLIQAFEIYCNETVNNKQNDGCVYRVTNDRNVESFLIGTIHLIPPQIIENPLFAHVITCSRTLISEPVMAWMYSLRQKCLKRYDSESLDLQLRTLAKEKGLALEVVESTFDQLYAFYLEQVKGLNNGDSDVDPRSLSHLLYGMIKEAMVRKSKLMWEKCQPLLRETENVSKLLNSKYLSKRDKVHVVVGAEMLFAKNLSLTGLDLVLNSMKSCKKSYQALRSFFRPTTEELLVDQVRSIPLYSCYKEGDASLFRNIVPSMEHLNDGRNKKWLEGTGDKVGMIDRIQNTDEPICYAVGAAHLFNGPFALIEKLKENGLKIERGSYDSETGVIRWTEIEG